MVSQTGPRVVRSNPCKGPVYAGKGPKKSQRAKQKFWGQQVLFGTKFLKFGPKRANLATLFLRYSMYEAVSLNAIMTHESQCFHRKATFSEGFL